MVLHLLAMLCKIWGQAAQWYLETCDNFRSTNDFDRSSVPLFLIAVSMMIPITYSPPCSSSDNSFFLQRINRSSPLVYHPSSFVNTCSIALSFLRMFFCTWLLNRNKDAGLAYQQSSLALRPVLWLRDLFTTDSISHHHHVHLSGCVSVCSKA